MIYDLIIIGAGPAGMFSAIYASKEGKKVLLLEKNNRLGKKLLISGSGKCNLTHTGTVGEFLEHYGDDAIFLKNALYKYSNKEVLNFFKKRDLNFLSDKNGKFFPETMKSQDILRILQNELNKNKVDIIKECEVTDIKKENEIFLVNFNKEKYLSKNLIISTGGCSYPQTGSDGACFNLLKKLGHKVEKLKSCLTPVYVMDYKFTDLSGLSFKSTEIELYRNNKKIKEHKGDVLFTHKNLSGPGILDFSRYIEIGDLLVLNFTKNSKDLFRANFIKSISENPKKTIKNILLSFDFPERFVKLLLDLTKIDLDTKCAEFSKVLRKNLIKQLTEFTYEVKCLGNFDIAMATKGGISLKEINSKTMESKLIKGLFFAGEVMDIDGDTGGYNIQAAISTAVLASRSIR